MATHTIEIGRKPYIKAEINKTHNGNYLLFCRYSESKETFSFEPNSADFSEWLEEEQIDEATALLYDVLQEWTDEVDEQDDEEAEEQAKAILDTENHIRQNWGDY